MAGRQGAGTEGVCVCLYVFLSMCVYLYALYVCWGNVCGCGFWGLMWRVLYCFIGIFQTAKLQKTKEGGRVRRQTERSLTDWWPHLRSALRTHKHTHWVCSMLYSATDHNAHHFLQEQALAPRITKKIFSSMMSWYFQPFCSHTCMIHGLWLQNKIRRLSSDVSAS